MIERFHRTVQDEHFRVMGRTRWYEGLAEIQADLETYLEKYNRRRPHPGIGTNGKTSSEVLVEGLDWKQKTGGNEAA